MVNTVSAIEATCLSFERTTIRLKNDLFVVAFLPFNNPAPARIQEPTHTVRMCFAPGACCLRNSRSDGSTASGEARMPIEKDGNPEPVKIMTKSVVSDWMGLTCTHHRGQGQCRIVQSCQERLRMSSVELAQDLRLLRQALGCEKGKWPGLVRGVGRETMRSGPGCSSVRAGRGLVPGLRSQGE